MTRAALVALALAGAACGASQPPPRTAATGPHPRLALVLGRGVDPVTARTDDARVVLVAPEPDAASAASTAAAGVARARTLYRDLAFEASLAALGPIQIALERDVRTAEDFGALFDVLALRAMNELALGRPDGARAALSLAFALRPDAALDEGAYPPDVRALAAEARAATHARAPGALAVTSEPSGAEVALDGVAAGRTPVSLHAPPGRHFVRVSALGFAPRLLPVELRSEGSPPLHVDLPAADAATTAAQVAALDAGALDALGAGTHARIAALLGADDVLLVTSDGTWRARPLSSDRPAASAATLDALVVAIRAGTSPARPAPASDEPGVLASPWLWIAAGGALLVGGGITAGVLLQDRRRVVTGFGEP